MNSAIWFFSVDHFVVFRGCISAFFKKSKGSEMLIFTIKISISTVLLLNIVFLKKVIQHEVHPRNTKTMLRELERNVAQGQREVLLELSEGSFGFYAKFRFRNCSVSRWGINYTVENFCLLSSIGKLQLRTLKVS